AHALADTLVASAQQQQYEIFFDLFLGRLAALLRVHATGRGKSEDLSLVERLLAPTGVADWAGVWEAVVHDKADVAEFNLDRKTLIMRAIARLQVAAKQ